jgi:hypothetical protein
MKFLKNLFRKKPNGETRILSRGQYFILINGRYVQGERLAI